MKTKTVGRKNKMKKNIFRVIALITCLITMLCAAACNESTETEAEENNAAGIYAVEYNGSVIELGEKADKVISKLGEPQSKQSAGNCGGKGEVFIYDYSAFVMSVVEYTDGDSIIDKIELRNDTAETSKGLCIGADEADIEKLYGDPTNSANGVMQYKKGDKILEISVNDGKVDTIALRIA